MIAFERTGAAMASTSRRFSTVPTPEQREKAGAFTHSGGNRHAPQISSRVNQSSTAGELALKDMTEPQRNIALELLQTGLSQRGYSA